MLTLGTDAVTRGAVRCGTYYRTAVLLMYDIHDTTISINLSSFEVRPRFRDNNDMESIINCPYVMVCITWACHTGSIFEALLYV